MPAKVTRKLKYVAPDGAEFDTIEEEIIHELKACGLTEETAMAVCSERQKLLAILRQGTRKNASPSKPKRTRTAKPQPATATA